MPLRGSIVNILSFSHPHVKSLINEGLWGFPDDKRGVNRKLWSLLEVGSQALIYGEHGGEKGLWFLCEVIDRFESQEPVSYWVQNPRGYPLQVRLKPIFPHSRMDLEALGRVKPVRRDELATAFGLRRFKARLDRWSLIVFSEAKEPLAHPYQVFEKLRDEFKVRNERIVLTRPDHEGIKETIYQIGFIQNRHPKKEYPINGRLLDVVWRRTDRSVPSVAFEVQVGGSLFEALSKLKHAFDLWNSIPVLVTTDEQVEEARRWVEGSFHELKDVLRVVSWREFMEYYDVKRKVKEVEARLRLA